MEAIGDLAIKTLNFLNSIPADWLQLIIESIISALIVSPFMVGVKKWFSIDGEKKLQWLVIGASMLSAVGVYLLTIPEFAPWIILIQGWLTFAFSQPIYKGLIKPLFARIGIWFTDQISRATLINEAKAAAVPPEGLPLSASSNMFDDFQPK